MCVRVCAQVEHERVSYFMGVMQGLRRGTPPRAVDVELNY